MHQLNLINSGGNVRGCGKESFHENVVCLISALLFLSSLLCGSYIQESCQ